MSLMSRSRILASGLGTRGGRVLLAVVLAGVAMTGPAAAASADVGHVVERITVPGSVVVGDLREQRAVDVHLWYPADPATASAHQLTVYTSQLHGRSLALPNGDTPWDPLSWTVASERAREGAPVDPAGGPFATIVFSHGSTNDPIDYAKTLEAIADAGFVVAAPGHTGNTQDDVRRDYINAVAGSRLFACEDGLPARAVPTLTSNGSPSPDCSKNILANSMADRARDISAVLTELPGWFGGRVDVARAGVLGHSRGTVSALASAGGSGTWGFRPEPRVKAIMGMAIGTQNVTSGADLAAVEIPTLLVRGMEDDNSVPAVSLNAHNAISSSDKRLVDVTFGTHRSFDSTYCAQLQSAAAAFDVNHSGTVEPQELTNTRPILDRHTVGLIAASAPAFVSGKAAHYCAFRFFTSPVNIEQLVAATPNAEYACSGAACTVVPPASGPATSTCAITIFTVPCTSLDTDQVDAQMTELAVGFFGRRLERDGDGVPDAADNCPATTNADQADADSDGSGDACDTTPQGTTPPRITTPGPITADATGPAGAAVGYEASADDDLDPHPALVCSPASGSVFVIGATTVDCVATDSGGNAASASFVVTILGATEQLSRLLGEVDDATHLPAPGKAPLTATLRAALRSFDHGNQPHHPQACPTLRAFISIVRSTAPPQAAEWTADANRIRAVLAC